MTVSKLLRLCLRTAGLALAGIIAAFLGLASYLGVRNEIATYACRTEDPRIKSSGGAIDFVKKSWNPDARSDPGIADTLEYNNPGLYTPGYGWKVRSQTKYGKVIWDVAFSYGHTNKQVIFTECGHVVEEWSGH